MFIFRVKNNQKEAFETLMSKIKASLFGCIAIFPSLTNLRWSWPVQLSNIYISFSGRYKIDTFWFIIFLICRLQHSEKLGSSRMYYMLLMCFFLFKQHLKIAFLVKIKTDYRKWPLWPKNRLYKFFLFFFKICRYGLYICRYGYN